MSRSVRMLALIAAAALCVVACSIVSRHYEKKFLTTAPNGPETPGTVGAPYERVTISSANRKLDGYMVRAPANCQPQVAVLIFHGVQETISEWVKAQRFLNDHCITSLVFDYSGHGDSSRPGTVRNLNQDVLAAYSFFVVSLPKDERVCVLGHSMGNGPMLEVLPHFQPPPACVVVANAFSSLRDEGLAHGMPRLLMWLTPDNWNNVKNVPSNHVPLMIVHSAADKVNAVEMGKRVYEAAKMPKEIVILQGFGHNALYKDPSEIWWAPVLRFIKGEGSSERSAPV